MNESFIVLCAAFSLTVTSWALQSRKQWLFVGAILVFVFFAATVAAYFKENFSFLF